jgi:hypothetical protein
MNCRRSALPARSTSWLSCIWLYQQYEPRPGSGRLEGSGTKDLLDHFYTIGFGGRFRAATVVALGATIPICFVSWWVAYRSDWF